MGLIRKNAGFQCSSSTVHALVAMRPKPKHDQGTFSTINPPSVRSIDASFCCASCITAAALCFIVKPSHRCHLRIAFAGSLNSQRAERHPSWHFIGIRIGARAQKPLGHTPQHEGRHKCNARTYGYGYESFPGLPGAPLAACTQATAPLQAQSWGGGCSYVDL